MLSKEKSIDPEIRALIDDLEQKLKALLGNKLKSIYLYGSYARGDYDSESDIDIFIVLDAPQKQFASAINDLVTEYLVRDGVLFSVVIETTETFNRYYNVLPFYRTVVAEGVVVYG